MNAYSQVHLGDDVRDHDLLDNFNAFLFESYLCKIRPMIKGNKKKVTNAAAL